MTSFKSVFFRPNLIMNRNLVASINIIWVMDFTFIKIRLVDKPDEKNKILMDSGQILKICKQNLLLRKAKAILLTSNGILHIQNKSFIKPNTRLFTMFYTHFKTGDIV